MPRRKGASQAAGSESGPFWVLLQAVVGALLVARLLVPPESAAQGETLWIVQLWLLAAVVWAWHCLREGGTPIRVGWCDVALWVLIAGHAVSAISVFYFGGQKRAAVNMLWEWVGLGVSFFLIRQVLRHWGNGSRLISVMLVTVVCLAGLGLWQHYVFYPQTAAEYEQHRSELDRLLNGPPPSSGEEVAARSRRLQELQQYFIERNIPFEGAERILFEQRLRASSEPFGTFALANTFAGVLAAWLIPALAVAFWACQGDSTQTWRCLVAAAAALLIAYCLILTKSRTAWVGGVAGLATWGAVSFGGLRRALRDRLWAVLAGVGVLAGLILVAAVAGGLDRDVLAEAPKSLRYRLQYWRGTWEVIREHPVLGIGPGNFRQHYLKHKLPESSEEIADPHNLVLAAWTSGGIVALLGMAGLLTAGAWAIARPTRPDAGRPRAKESHQNAPGWWSPLTVGAAFGFPLTVAGMLLLGEGFDIRMPVLLVAWLAAAWIYGKIPNFGWVSNVSLGAGCIVLLVHLLGAGGFEMPAIVQTLLVLLAVGSTQHRAVENRRGMIAPALAVGGVAVVLCVACLRSATIPVLNGRATVSAGDAALLGGETRRAVRFYAEAAEVDPLSPVPPLRIAGTFLRRWRRVPDLNAADFERGIAALETAIQLDPFSHAGYRLLGESYRDKFDHSRDPADADAAAKAFRQAVRRYPTDARLRANLALALAKSGKRKTARQEARAALAQDRLNRREGHREKYLPGQTLEHLRGLRGPTSSLPGQD